METHTPKNENGLTPTRENYLRTLFQLSRTGEGVRLTDLARAEGVRLPTARHAVNCLRDLGFASQENYGRILLTERGQALGQEICNRFELTRKFLIEVLGVHGETAEREACIMEHHLSDATLERIAVFVNHVTECPGGSEKGPDCILNLRNDVQLQTNGKVS